MIEWKVVKVSVRTENEVREMEESSKDRFPEEVFYEVADRMGVCDSPEVSFVRKTGDNQVLYGLKGRNSGIEVEVLVEFQ